MMLKDETGKLITMAALLEDLSPSDLSTALDRSRPYSGQLHTSLGERGKAEVKGVTFRDIRDCFIIGCFSASGLSAEEYPESVYKLPWDKMDIIAVAQCMSREIEKRMGIYPNVPLLEYKNDP